MRGGKRGRNHFLQISVGGSVSGTSFVLSGLCLEGEEGGGLCCGGERGKNLTIGTGGGCVGFAGGKAQERNFSSVG